MRLPPHCFSLTLLTASSIFGPGDVITAQSEIAIARVISANGGSPAFAGHGTLTSSPTFEPFVFSRGESWSFDGRQWLRLPDTGPAAVQDYALASDLVRQTVVLFGGAGASGFSNETWTFNASGWLQVATSTSPPPRIATALAFESATGSIVLFGGRAPNTTLLADTWTFDGTNWTQQSPGTAPAARDFASFANGPGGPPVLFGGSQGPTVQSNDTWLYSQGSWSQVSTPNAPTDRYRAAFAFDLQRNVFVLAGGARNTLVNVNGTNVLQIDALNDVFEFDPAASTWSAPIASGEFDLGPDAGAAFDGSTGQVLVRTLTNRTNWVVRGAGPGRNRTASLGTACRSPFGTTPAPELGTVGDDRPILGNQLELAATRWPSTAAFGVLALGLSDQFSGPIPLPTSLATFGVASLCPLRVAADAPVVVLPTNGAARFAVSIPANPAFVGVDLFAQFLVPDPSAVVPFQYEVLTSNAIGLRVGN